MTSSVLRRFRYNQALDISGTSGSHLAETLQPLYSSSNTGYVIWNDQPLTKSTVKPKSLHAHAKGKRASGLSWRTLIWPSRGVLSPDCNYWTSHPHPV